MPPSGSPTGCEARCEARRSAIPFGMRGATASGSCQARLCPFGLYVPSASTGRQGRAPPGVRPPRAGAPRAQVPVLYAVRRTAGCRAPRPSPSTPLWAPQGARRQGRRIRPWRTVRARGGIFLRHHRDSSLGRAGLARNDIEVGVLLCEGLPTYCHSEPPQGARNHQSATHASRPAGGTPRARGAIFLSAKG